MEIFCYQNVESLFGIFNALAGIVGSDPYIGSMAAVVAIGFLMAFLAYAFAPQKLIGWQWLASVLLVYTVLLVPKVDVHLVDKTGGMPARVVANVPFGVAAFGSVTSAIGNALTEVFETAFQAVGGRGNLPAELAYQQNGLMFGARMIKNGREVVLMTPTFRTDVINFLANCTQYDLLPGGTINPTVFAKSSNVWSLMGNPNPGRFTTITSGVGAPTITDCRTAYGTLSNLLAAEVAIVKSRLAQVSFPHLTPADALLRIDPALQIAYQYNRIADAATTADQLIVNNAMINAINDASDMIGQRANDPSSVLLAVGRAQATAQTNASWINSGKVAEQALPLIRNAIEAICYALFPLVILVLFLTWGPGTARAIKSYLMTLVWIQFWPPIYAVLNYMASVATAQSQGAAAEIGGGLVALSLQTASPVYQGAISAQAVVGYLVLSVPAIAWAVLKGMETVGQAALTGTSSIQSTVGHASGAAALGSPLAMGNVSHQQQLLSPQRTSAMMRTWQDDGSGDTFTRNTASGLTAWRQLQNDGMVSATMASGVRSQVADRATRGIDSAISQRTSAERAANAALADLMSHTAERNFRTGGGLRWNAGTTADFKQAMQNFQQVSKDANLTQDQKAAILSLITGEAHAKVGLSPKMLMEGIRTVLGGKDGLTPEQVTAAARAEQGSLMGIGGEPPSKESVADKLARKLANGLYKASKLVDLEVGAAVAGRGSASDQVGTGARVADAGSSGDRGTTDDVHGTQYARMEAFERMLTGGVREDDGKRAEFREAVGRMQSADASLREHRGLLKEVSHGTYASDEVVVNFIKDPKNTPLLQRLWDQAGGDQRTFAISLANELASRSMLSRPAQYSDGSAVAWTDDGVRNLHNTNAAGISLNKLREADTSGEVRAAYGSMAAKVPKTIGPVGDGGPLIRQVEEELARKQAQVATGQGNIEQRAKDVELKAQNQTGMQPGETNPGNSDHSTVTGVVGVVGASAATSGKQAIEMLQNGVGEVANGLTSLGSKKEGK